MSLFYKSMQVNESLLKKELEPQVTSADPNERKLARRLRIERRWEALKKSRQNIQEDSKTVQEEVHDDIQMQVKKSTELLEKYLLEGEEYITNVRIANDSREVDRRESEGINKEKVFEQLDEEATAANELFTQIANKWALIQRQNDPLRINEEITDQKEKCDLLIKQKDEIIAMLNDELKKAERQFTRDQRKQMEDINTLSHRIEQQVSFMRRAYRQELNLVEDVIEQERQYLIDSTDRKWQELYTKRENQEYSNSVKKVDQVDEFNERMDKLRMDFQEHCRETKIKLENDIEELQRELEKIKALALLNSEKLDYNYQILKKREDENIIIKSQQKRRMNKLQDVINDLRKMIAEYELNTSNKIKKLSENIKKLHKSIIDVEAKADHFAHVNDEKFHKLWEMNKKRVQGVLRKILETDKVLYEQQMGLDWEAPGNFTVDKKSLPSYKLALNTVPAKFVYDACKAPPSKNLKQRKSVTSRSTVMEAANVIGMSNYRRVLKLIFTRISDKSGFLAERRLKELLAGYIDNQKNLVRLDNVFSALKIQGTQYIDMLFQYFEPYTFCPVCQGSMIMQQSRIESKANSSGSQLSSVYLRFGETENFRLNELEDVIDAIRQPDSVLDAVIAELVTSEDFYADDSSSDQSDPERIDDICGVAAMNQYISEKTKDKSKTSALRKRMSVTSRGPVDQFACQFRHPLVISIIFLLRALRDFVTAYYVGRPGVPSIGDRLEQRRLTISRFITENDIKIYWEKFKLNFGEDRVRVWDALLAGLKKYHEILKDRKTICEEVLKLRRENAELKRLLSTYLDHSEFLPPSCAKERENFLH